MSRYQYLIFFQSRYKWFNTVDNTTGCKRFICNTNKYSITSDQISFIILYFL